MINNNSLVYKFLHYLKKIKWIIIVLFIVIIFYIGENSSHVTTNINTDDFHYSNVSDSGNFILKCIYIFIMFICLVLCIKKLVKKYIVIDHDQIKIISKLFCIKIKSKYYLNEKIDKFVIGLLADKKNSCVYNIYIDQENNIHKIMTLETYKECMEIMKQIKEKCNIKIFDGTNRIYITEEDIYREYYKFKNMIDEIKNE